MGDAAGGQTLDERVAVMDEATSTAAPSGETPAPATDREPVPDSPPIRWRFWRSPADQPRWARPALLVVAALAALSYSWGMTTDTLEVFYAGAVRSMSQNWHNFFFGAFDPWGTVSVDKLPGAFWLQALSVRIFGSQVWAYALPSAIEGTLTVLVLYRVVRRVGGPIAGLTAAVALAATPVTVLLNRGNISDSLLVLLLVLAADATTRAYMTGRAGSLALAGVWVGLAFQAKMVQAWLVLPALYLAYLVAAPAASLLRRIGHVTLSLVVVVVVSLSWMTVVTLVPAHDRPYVDGSCDNSVFSQVFEYNGADRVGGNTLDQAGCNPAPAAVPASPGGHDASVAIPLGPGRFLNGIFGRDSDWLLVPAAVSLIGILVTRRREPRTDILRATTVLWATWLFLTWCFFASSHFINSYYLAAFSPPIAALCGVGLALAWHRRERPATRAVVAGTVVAAAAYGLYLLPPDAGVRPWIVSSVLLLGLTAVAVAVVSLSPRGPAWTVRAVVGVSAAALLSATAWASATVVAAQLGPFDSPYQPAALTAADHAANARSAALADDLARTAAKIPPRVSVITLETSAQASAPIMATGHEFLPVGGFTGRAPSPTFVQFIGDVRLGRVALVLARVAPRTRNPDMLWVIAHCPRRPDRGIGGPTMGLFVCSPADAAG
jgi:4-amino-4-deoxy-L-arabinose transferase-like glycosyltransferase